MITYLAKKTTSPNQRFLQIRKSSQSGSKRRTHLLLAGGLQIFLFVTYCGLCSSISSRPPDSAPQSFNPSTIELDATQIWTINNDWRQKQQLRQPAPSSNSGPFANIHLFANNQVTRDEPSLSSGSLQTNSSRPTSLPIFRQPDEHRKALTSTGWIVANDPQSAGTMGQRPGDLGNVWQAHNQVSDAVPAARLGADNKSYSNGDGSLPMGPSRDDQAPIVKPACGLPGRCSLRKALLSLQNPRLMGGDILVRMKPSGRPRNGRLLKFERSALVSPVSLWPNGVIFYELDASVDHLSELIWRVMRQFHNYTCIRFIPRENNEPDYLRFEALKGCFSYIGRIGGEQILSLGDGCEYTGTISHELLHAVGFFHHQNRSDRDDFLEILWENIAKGKENQFSKMDPHENILLNKFDYNSIMLYGPRTFGKTLDRATMRAKTEGVMLLEVIEKQGLSALDIDSVNKLYKCETSSYTT